MEIESLDSKAIKIKYILDNKVVGRASLFLIENELHDSPYGLLEDVYVDEESRGKGIGSELIERVIEESKKLGCYKLLATSRLEREKVHSIYEKLGFEKWGFEFRMNLDN